MARTNEIKARDAAAKRAYREEYNKVIEAGGTVEQAEKCAEYQSASVYGSWPIDGDH